MVEKVKLSPFYHVIEIKEIERYYRITGEVTKSNFLNETHNYCMPIIDEPIKKGIIKEGDRLKVTFFADKDAIEQDEEKIKFKAEGVRMEVWDEASACWDMVYEKFGDDS